MRKIIMDCDPGHDDMVAMVIAFASRQLQVMAVTTCAGNQTQEKVNYNARKILSFLGIQDVPVARGCEKPFCRPLRVAEHAHGVSGLDGADIGEPQFESVPQHAVELMRDILQRSDDKITIVATGPLTNVAMLLTLYPHLKNKIECISFMGGSAYSGNVTARAEFNILVDPESAKVVMGSGVPLIMCGLEVTHKALMRPVDIERLRAVGNKLSTAMADLISFYRKSAKAPLFAPTDFVIGAYMHDPCAVAILLEPQRFQTADLFGDIELSGQYNVGSTVIDVSHALEKEPNVKVAFDVDSEWMINLIIQSAAHYRD